jgi:hypothetical protein
MPQDIKVKVERLSNPETIPIENSYCAENLPLGTGTSRARKWMHCEDLWRQAASCGAKGLEACLRREVDAVLRMRLKGLKDRAQVQECQGEGKVM